MMVAVNRRSDCCFGRVPATSFGENCRVAWTATASPCNSSTPSVTPQTRCVGDDRPAQIEPSALTYTTAPLSSAAGAVLLGDVALCVVAREKLLAALRSSSAARW